MKIRLSNDQDCAEIARVHRATIRHINSKDYPENIIKAWAGRTSAKRFRDSLLKGAKRWVAVDKDKIVGFVDHGKGDELWGLYVHKNYIGKGVGSKLLEIAEDSLKKQGAKNIKTESTITARPFYEKHGYKFIKKNLHPIFGDRKNGLFVNTCIMEKKLPKGTRPE